jgi:SAM-dependent methyltransferase
MMAWLLRHGDSEVFGGLKHEYILCAAPQECQEIRDTLSSRYPELGDVPLPISGGGGRLAGHRLPICIGRRDIVVLHSIFPCLLPHFLLLRPDCWHRTAWIMWGGDLKAFVRGLQRSPKSTRARVWKRVCPRLGAVGALAPDDFKVLANALASAAPKKWSPFIYGISLRDEGCGTPRTEEDRPVILLGNSADPSNQHLEGIALLEKIRGQADVICPLGYGGSPDYAREIAARGNRDLGESFYPMLEMASKEHFDSVLDSVDIVVYLHDRQQGLYTLTRVLQNGGKAFLRAGSPTYEMLLDQDIRIFSLEDLKASDPRSLTAPLPTTDQVHNRRQIQRARGLEAALEGWSRLLAPCLPVP